MSAATKVGGIGKTIGKVALLLVAGVVFAFALIGWNSADKESDAKHVSAQQESMTKSAETSQPQSTQDTRRKFFYLAQGAPICPDLKSMIAIESVMQSNNEIAVQTVLGKFGCELTTQVLEFDSRTTLVRELNERFVTISGRSGGAVTSKEFLKTESHDKPQLAGSR